MCINKISYMMPKGNFGYIERLVECGTTDPYGERALCDDCSKDKAKMESLARHDANMKADNAWLGSAGYGEL